MARIGSSTPEEKKAFSKNNLLIAWRRITTAQSIQYKSFFRRIYYAFEAGIEENVSELSARLLGGSYKPSPATRVLLPKPSGLQRPISLLHIEDQIVLQAVANLFAERIRPKRSELENKFVFSNVLNSIKDSPFFLEDWHTGYRKYQEHLVSNVNAGNMWVGFFDLAAFYDTISHEYLFRSVFPREGGNELRQKLREYFEVWSSAEKKLRINHGIPQGPRASDFLSECYLLAIDQMLVKKGIAFSRYVDDIRLFGKTKEEVQRAVIYLDKLCKERGLIPQAKKLGIRRIEDANEFLLDMPSIPVWDEGISEEVSKLSFERTRSLFEEAVDKTTLAIRDKSRFRYVLFRGWPDKVVLNVILKMFPLFPEHVEAILAYCRHFEDSSEVIKSCLLTLDSTPYPYVAGNIWHLLARRFEFLDWAQQKQLLSRAVDLAKSTNLDFQEKWGVLHFLCVADWKGSGKYARWLTFQESALVQAATIPKLSFEALKREPELVNRLLKRSSVEPSVLLCEKVATSGMELKDLGINSGRLKRPAKNVAVALGLITKKGHKPIDVIDEVIRQRYNVPQCDWWRTILGPDYSRALHFLNVADSVYLSGRSQWLRLQNGFNEQVFRQLLQKMGNEGMTGGRTVFVDAKGKLIKYGTLLDKNQAFSRTHPQIADSLRAVNQRRNKEPESHPYDERTGNRTKYLTKHEQSQLKAQLTIGYGHLIQLLDSIYIKRTPKTP